MSSNHSTEVYKAGRNAKKRPVNIETVDDILTEAAKRLRKVDIQNSGQIIVNYNVERNDVDTKITISV